MNSGRKLEGYGAKSVADVVDDNHYDFRQPFLPPYSFLSFSQNRIPVTWLRRSFRFWLQSVHLLSSLVRIVRWRLLEVAFELEP
ncbi:hypothetical protein LINPERHAP1_LOCUS15827 [Linum perenne]